MLTAADKGALGLSQAQFPEEINSRIGRLFILGTAGCVWDDMLAAGFVPEEGRFRNADIMAINHAGLFVPARVDHWYCHHNGMLEKWRATRRSILVKRWGGAMMLHSQSPGMALRWPWEGKGTSSLGAVLTGLALGYEPIVVCGCPLDDSPQFFSPPWVECVYDKDGYLDAWRGAYLVMKGRVFSMSGRTRDLLGEPAQR